MIYCKAMLCRKNICSLLFACCLLAGTALAELVPNQVIVKFKPGIVKLPRGLAVAGIKAAAVSAASVRALNAKYKVAEFKQMYTDALAIRPDWKHLDNEYILTFSATADVIRARDEYKKDASVVTASANSYVRAFDITPNDPFYSEQWGLVKIKAPAGWVKTTGTNESIIAILDTGINYDHEDFSGKVDLADAKNYVSGGTDPLDDFGHGTAVSGIIGAVTDNSLGIAGLDWHAKLLPIKVLDSSGSGDISDISEALAYLTAKKTAGKNIVAANMSLGQYNTGADHYTEEDPASLKERCQEAYNAGIVLVAAAGNGNVDWNTYPAYYSTVLAVAATDQDDKRSVWTGIDPDTGQTQASNYASWVDVAAPGSGIFSTVMSGSYANGWNGTSLASPFVAGLAGLIKAVNPALSPASVYAQIAGLADNIDALNPGYAGKLGSGRINVYRSLAGLVSEITSPASGEYIRGTKTITGTAGGWNFASFEVAALKSGGVEETIIVSTTSVESGTLAAWNTAAGRYGPYTVRLLVWGAGGTSSEADVSVVVDNVTPEAAIVSPASGASISGRITITGRATDEYFDHYILEYGAGGSPASYQSLGAFYAPVEGGVLATWETAGLAGTYALRLTVYDRVGNVSVEAVSLNILSETPTKAVQAEGALPLTFALPNPFVRTSTTETTFSYSLAGNFNATIYLFDVNGSLVWQKSYAAGENGGKAGANSPSWDGLNLYGASVASGVYLYQVTADKKVIGRGKVIVLN